MPATQNQCSPAMKKSAAQTSETSIVWPKSGCRIKGTMVISNNSSEKCGWNVASLTRLRKGPCHENGEMPASENSEGWTPKIQRRDPLISWP